MKQISIFDLLDAPVEKVQKPKFHFIKATPHKTSGQSQKEHEFRHLSAWNRRAEYLQALPLNLWQRYLSDKDYMESIDNQFFKKKDLEHLKLKVIKFIQKAIKYKNSGGAISYLEKPWDPSIDNKQIAKYCEMNNYNEQCSKLRELWRLEQIYMEHYYYVITSQIKCYSIVYSPECGLNPKVEWTRPTSL